MTSNNIQERSVTEWFIYLLLMLPVLTRASHLAPGASTSRTPPVGLHSHVDNKLPPGPSTRPPFPSVETARQFFETLSSEFGDTIHLPQPPEFAMDDTARFTNSETLRIIRNYHIVALRQFQSITRSFISQRGVDFDSNQYEVTIQNLRNIGNYTILDQYFSSIFSEDIKFISSKINIYTDNFETPTHYTQFERVGGY